MKDDWEGPWPGEPAFIFPEALRLVALKEAEAYIHDGCPFCEKAIRAARRAPKRRVLVNAKTGDVLGVFYP